jgi:HK97 family phage major capsid protein
LGARVMQGLVGNVAIPRETVGITPTWQPEATDAANDQPTFDQLSLTPHDLSINVEISRRLLQQSTPAVDSLVRNDIARYLAIGVDKAAINGAGASNEPLGILGTSGVTVVPLGSNGAAPTWAGLVGCIGAVASANALRGELGWLVNGAVMACLMKTPKIGSTFPEFMWSDGAAPNERTIAGFRALVSNSVPSNLTKSAGSSLSAAIFGNWNDVIIGVWGGVDLIVDPYSKSKQGTLEITAFRTVDIAIRHGESFGVIKDMVTT